MDYKAWIEVAGIAIEIAGVAVIVIGIIVATSTWLRHMREDGEGHPYQAYRRSIGRAILLGLEFLVAGDIIRTVAVEPTFHSLGLLAIVVALRIVLSVELEMELEGRWPWQSERKQSL
jgi:uncharacterized membrane protein